MRLQDKVAIVTGAGSGIGRADSPNHGLQPTAVPLRFTAAVEPSSLGAALVAGRLSIRYADKEVRYGIC